MANLKRRALWALTGNPTLERLVGGTDQTRDAAWRRARRYVAGRTLEEAQPVVVGLAGRGLAVSVDRFGERVTDADVAKAAADEYVALAEAVAGLPEGIWLSADLSHLGLDVSLPLCRELVERVLAALPSGRRLQLGAEDSWRTDAILRIVEEVAGAGGAIGATLQANLRRSQVDADRLAAAAVPVRLVKGAYPEAANVAYEWGEQTDLAYLRLARQLHHADVDVALATHDRVLREALLPELPAATVEMLLGVRNDDAEALLQAGRTVRMYVPYGADWLRYYLRRIPEAQAF